MLKFFANTVLYSRVLGVSTKTHIPEFYCSLSSVCSFKAKDDSLYNRLVPAWRPSDSVIPILDEWRKQGKPLSVTDLRRFIRQFRASRRYRNALQICEWMGEVELFDLKSGHIAVQLHLISKVHGVEKAEEYFSSIPKSSITFQVYGALLQCYAESKYFEKAESIMQKMREMGNHGILTYNIMASLYSKTRKFDEMNALIKEVEQKGIERDRHSYNIQLNSLVSSSDIKGMEMLLMKMEIDPLLTIDWRMYSIAAEGYMKVGDTEKASQVLNKFEHLVRGNRVITGYNILMTQYARLGKKQDVYRIFNLLQNGGKFQNQSYMCMISSLEKMDDLEGAEKIIEKWLVNKRYPDMNVPNLLVSAYCKKDQAEKAELFIKSLTDRELKPNASTWSRLALGYLKCKNEEKAVEMMKRAILQMQSPEEINFYTLAGCLEYLKKIGDVNRAEELIQFTEEHNQSAVDVRSRIKEYITEGNLAPNHETSEEAIV
ncbi:hypothetical protein Leryth_013534 [Lithospermum erythrorhizon]|nr:hypothetical protein Leryth_013534 [Lithospermum erythrorhizon]